MEIKADILDGQSLLCEGVVVNLDFQDDCWSGSFILACGTCHPKPGETYQVVLENGRSGDIIIISAHPGSTRDTLVTFVVKEGLTAASSDD